MSINVNISHQSFHQPDLIDHIHQILQETSLDSCNLKLEITEDVVIED